MAYRLDPTDNSIVIDGWQNGIAESPYMGLSDMRNINIISIPDEASVNFATTKASAGTVTAGTVTAADAGTKYLTYTGATGLEDYMAITFSAQSGLLPNGNSDLGVVFWVKNLGAGVFKITTDYVQSNVAAVTNGTGTFSVVAMDKPMYFTYDELTGAYFMIDYGGRVWSDTFRTGVNDYWTYTGNKPVSAQSYGQGIVAYTASNGFAAPGNSNSYVFAFSTYSIDYLDTTTLAWAYQWDPSAGTVGSYSATPTQVLHANDQASPHEAIWAPDNQVYYCDKNWISRFFQNSPTVAFNPTNNTTYTFDTTQLLPDNDRAKCLTYLGDRLLVGGQLNRIYMWDTNSTQPTNILLLPESSVAKMVTVNTNTYALVGNRGRVYKTNGTQAQLYKKLPDHISATVEPYFIWGGMAFNKNQVIFSALCTDNANIYITGYGGIWSIDVDTEALRLTNKLSYGTYAGYATAIVTTATNPHTVGNPPGAGLYIGWQGANGSGPYGIDKTSSTPYTGSEAVIETDLIPVGTFDIPKNFTRIEYKLVRPIINGESIVLSYRTDFSQAYTDVLTGTYVSGGNNYAQSGPINFSNAQWIQFKITLNSVASTPTYTRLREIRIR
jgi:hypothetical protein